MGYFQDLIDNQEFFLFQEEECYFATDIEEGTTENQYIVNLIIKNATGPVDITIHVENDYGEFRHNIEVTKKAYNIMKTPAKNNIFRLDTTPLQFQFKKKIKRGKRVVSCFSDFFFSTWG